MAISQIDHVWKHSKADGAALLLLLAIADNANDSGYAYPGVVYLAHKCRMSERHIPRLVKKLETMGELRVIREIGKSNQYLIITPISGGKNQGQDVTPDKMSGVKVEKGLTPDKMSPPPLTNDDLTPDKIDKTPDIAMSYEPLTIKLNPKREPMSLTSKQKTSAVSKTNQLKDILLDQIGIKQKATFDKYIDPIEPIIIEDGVLYLDVQDQDIQFIEDHFLSTMLRILPGLQLEGIVLHPHDKELVL